MSVLINLTAILEFLCFILHFTLVFCRHIAVCVHMIVYVFDNRQSRTIVHRSDVIYVYIAAREVTICMHIVLIRWPGEIELHT